MSAMLCWEPAHQNREYEGNKLRHALQKRFDSFPRTFGTGDIPYLNGLLDAGIEDAEHLIKGIRKYVSIIVRLEH